MTSKRKRRQKLAPAVCAVDGLYVQIGDTLAEQRVEEFFVCVVGRDDVAYIGVSMMTAYSLLQSRAGFTARVVGRGLIVLPNRPSILARFAAAKREALA